MFSNLHEKLVEYETVEYVIFEKKIMSSYKDLNDMHWIYLLGINRVCWATYFEFFFQNKIVFEFHLLHLKNRIRFHNIYN